jgi:parallel beta-helix repeat protein
MCLLLLPLFTVGVAGTAIHPRLQFVPENHEAQQLVQSGPRLLIGNDELASVATAGSGSQADPYLIQYMQFEGETFCLDIRDTTAYFEIRNSVFNSWGVNSEALSFGDVVNGAVIDCHFYGASSGIHFINCSDSRIEYCHIYDNSANGIHLYATDNCLISENMLYANNKGIMFEGSTFNQVVNNSIYRNTFAGIEFEPYSQNNTVYGNSIGWNSFSAFGDAQVNVRNNAPGNRFDNGVDIGNRWADFNETYGVYSVRGDYRENDTYASLYEDLTEPYVSSPFDIAIDLEATGNILTWAASDDAPYQYTVFLNDITYSSAIWDGGLISILLDMLNQGTHNLTLVLMDAAGNTQSDSVLVTAVSFVFGGMGTELVMLASGVTVLVFLLLMVLVKKIA